MRQDKITLMTDTTKIKSMRFFPDWDRTNGSQIRGLIEMMYDINKLRNGKHLECVEIGSHTGESALIMSSFPFIKRFHCVDIHENEDIKKRLKQLVMLDRVKIIFQDSEEYAPTIPDNSIDMVYIDANHDYDSVKRDLNTWSSKVKKSGFICGHDYSKTFWGVIQSVNELSDLKQALVKNYVDGSYMIQKTWDVKPLC